MDPSSIWLVEGPKKTELYHTLSDFKYLKKVSSASPVFSAYFARRLTLKGESTTSKKDEFYMVIYRKSVKEKKSEGGDKEGTDTVKSFKDPHFVLALSLKHNDEFEDVILESAFYPSVASITQQGKLMLSRKVYARQKYQGLRASSEENEGPSVLLINENIELMPKRNKIEETGVPKLIMGLAQLDPSSEMQEMDLATMLPPKEKDTTSPKEGEAKPIPSIKNNDPRKINNDKKK